MHDPACQHDQSGHQRLSRRRLLAGAAAGIGVLGAWRAGAVLADVSALADPANAVNPAERLKIPEYQPPPSTTTTTVPIDPPGPGEILFPLVLGTDWTCYVLDNFGDTRGRCCGYYHKGVDIMADLGTPQVAVVDGILGYRHEANTYGWTLEGDDGSRSRYFHNTEDPAGWSLGDRVQQGDVIGYTGDSGTSAGNYHLHFEYYPPGSPDTPIDPFDSLQRIPGATFQS